VDTWSIDPTSAQVAADVLGMAMEDDPLLPYLIPDAGRRRKSARAIYLPNVQRVIQEGRADAVGRPMAGVALWIVRPALAAGCPPTARTQSPAVRDPLIELLGADGAGRAETFAAAMQELRTLARPDRHAYLDTVGVAPEYRGKGFATVLLEAGHAWADAAGLPCALDTLTDENVAFYRRRGYRVVGTIDVPGSSLRTTAMRRT
jgi:GNAT superfamily N-acetyltransferase